MYLTTWQKDTKYPEGIGYNTRPSPPTTIVVHTTNGTKGSLFEKEAAFLCNNSISKDDDGNWVVDERRAVSANFLIGKQGQIAVIVDPKFQAWHAGKLSPQYAAYNNATSIGIEVHYTPGEGVWTDAMWKALTELVQDLMTVYRIPKENVETHRRIAYPVGRKIDPSGVTDSEFYRWRATLTAQNATPKMEQHQVGRYTPQSAFVSIAPPIDPAWVVDFIFRNTTPLYPRSVAEGSDGVEQIVRLYAQEASAHNLDWWLVFSQMCHETGKLTSWWCLPPRRNPAGIGVTGAFNDVRPSQGAWEYNERDRLWKAGHRFASWGAAVRAHVAHLLCYIYTDAEMTPAQRSYTNYSPRRDFIPLSYRGKAKTIEGLTQRWAYSKVLPPEGQRYHNRIAAIANSL